MKPLLVMPILIPLAAAAVSLILRRSGVVRVTAGVAGPALVLAAALALMRAVWRDGIQAVQIGGWPAPFGITIVADMFSAMMVAIAAMIVLSVAVYSIGAVDPARQSLGYFALLNVLLMGICGAFLTGDLFNLYVWFEVMLIASFVLLVLGGERGQMEGAIKYVTLNLMSSAILLAAVGILYGLTGTLNMADLAGKLGGAGVADARTAVAMMFLVAFGIKAAVFPFFFWLPASYHTPPVAVSAVFAGLLTKVGVYALMRVFTLLFIHDVGRTHALLTVIAALTMVTGVLGAAAQHDFRRILSFHIISQIGYMIMGLGLYTRAALMGSVFYIVHHIIVKTNLFLISGVVKRLGGSFELERLGGLYRRQPWLAVLFLIPAMSLAGMPPLSGFFAKLALIQSGLDIGQHAIVAVALAVGLLTLFSMTKLWNEAFWKAPPDSDEGPAGATDGANASMPAMVAPVCVLAALTVLIGFGAGPVLSLSARAADELMDPSAYVAAVMGGRP